MLLPGIPAFSSLTLHKHSRLLELGVFDDGERSISVTHSIVRPTYLAPFIDPFPTERQAVSFGELSISKDGAFEMLDLDN